ncbi:MAG TPA: DUF1580 domain-containing protein [Planctomycetaceae bacterium]|nr:DUF1580 domain-containing protein [Planctomycetaceae bacterium]
MTLDELLEDGQALTTAQAARLLPGTGRGGRLSPATVARWMTKGRRGVVLESVLLGGRRWTTRSALAVFLEAVNRRADEDSAPPLHTTTEPTRVSRTRISEARRAVGLKA